MKQPDAVLQEIWRVKDVAFEAAGGDPHRFVAQLQARSAQLREGLALRPLNTKSHAPLTSVRGQSTTHPDSQ